MSMMALDPACWITTTVPMTVDATGRIRFNAVIAQTSDDGDFVLVLDSAAGYAQVDFEVTALAKTTVTPGFGAQASTLTVSGVNFPKIAGEDVTLQLTDGLTTLHLVLLLLWLMVPGVRMSRYLPLLMESMT